MNFFMDCDYTKDAKLKCMLNFIPTHAFSPQIIDIPLQRFNSAAQFSKIVLGKSFKM